MFASIRAGLPSEERPTLLKGTKLVFPPAQMSQTTGVNKLLLNTFTLPLKARFTRITKNMFSQLPSAG